MLFATFTSVFLIATSWADATLVKRQYLSTGIVNACTPSNKLCQRVAVARVDGTHGVSGYFKFISPRSIDDVKVLLSVSGLGAYPQAADQGFTYHVHTNTVGQGHNCTATNGHLNPIPPVTPVCDPKALETCDYGDLSGKHGKLFAEGNSMVKRSYVDTQLRFWPPEFSMVGRSIVIHDAQGNRIACGNVVYQYPKIP